MLVKVSPVLMTWVRGVAAEVRPPAPVFPLTVTGSVTFAPELRSLPLARLLAYRSGGKVLSRPLADRPPGVVPDCAGVMLRIGPGLLALRIFSQSSGVPPAAEAGVAVPPLAAAPLWPAVPGVPSGSKGSFFL